MLLPNCQIRQTPPHYSSVIRTALKVTGITKWRCQIDNKFRKHQYAPIQLFVHWYLMFGVNTDCDVRLSDSNLFSFLFFATEGTWSSSRNAMTVVALDGYVLLQMKDHFLINGATRFSFIDFHKATTQCWHLASKWIFKIMLILFKPYNEGTHYQLIQCNIHTFVTNRPCTHSVLTVCQNIAL